MLKYCGGVLFVFCLLLGKSQTVAADSITFPVKDRKIYGQEIVGGDNYEDAKPVKLTVEFRLNHHQDKAYYDYFFIDVQAGQRIEVVAQTGEKGLLNSKESGGCHTGIQLHNTQRVSIAAKRVRSCHSQEAISYIAPTAERYFLLVGDRYGQIHKDFATYSVTLSDLWDSNTQADAGNFIDSAIVIDFDKEIGGNLSYGDETDLYRFAGIAGQKVEIDLASDGSPRRSVSATLISDFGQEFETQLIEGLGEVTSKEIALPSSGEYTLRVNCHRRTKMVLNHKVGAGKCFSSSSPTKGEFKQYRLQVRQVGNNAPVLDSWKVEQGREETFSSSRD